MNQYEIRTTSVEETQKFGERWGQWMAAHQGGICIALDGDLGAGKTHFSQGIAKGFGVIEDVTSPTFAIMNTYEVKGQYLYHFDLYRMDLEEELEAIGFYEFTEDRKSIIEWANKFEEALPSHSTHVMIEINTDGSRQFTIQSSFVSLETMKELGAIK